MSQKLPADAAELRGMVMDALAEVRVCSPADLVSGGQPNQLKLSAKETNYVAAAIEEITGKSELVTPADFSTPKTRSSKTGKDVSPNGCMDPGAGTTVKHMVDLLGRRLGLSSQQGGQGWRCSFRQRPSPRDGWTRCSTCSTAVATNPT